MLLKSHISIGRFTVPVAQTGDRGPLIVCINGAQQTMASWQSAIRYFVPRDWRLLLFDFPGQGRARIEHGPPAVSLDEQVQAAADVLDRFASNERVHLLAGSWGAVVAAATAARRPERVDRMVLGSFQTTPSQALLRIAERGRQHIRDGQRECLADLFVDGFGALLPEARKASIRRQMEALPDQQAEHLATLSYLFADGGDVRNHVDLGSIQARTLILNGEADPIVERDNLAEAVALIPRCEGYLVPGTGHFLHNERPELLAIYERFFSGDESAVPRLLADLRPATMLASHVSAARRRHESPPCLEGR